MLKQLVFITFSLALEFSITTVNFIFFEKISYKAAIGVGSLMAILYMSQNMVTLFAQAMINNAIYHDPTQRKDFNKIISAGFILSIVLSCVVAFTFFIAKDYIITLFNIDEEAKKYALKYITYMIPFFLIYNIEQYLTYTLYALKLAKLNFLYILCILILNIIYSYIAVFLLNLETAGIALSSALSILTVLPLYFVFIARHKVKITFKLAKKHFKSAFVGLKKLGLAAVAEPILHQFIQFYISILIAQIAQEMISSRYHARNFLTFSVTLALAFGVILQMNVAKYYGEKALDNAKNFYKNVIKYGILSSFSITLVALVFIASTMKFGWYTSNPNVQHFIVVCMAMGLIVEPMRFLSISSKAYLKGLQIANIPLIFSLVNKGLISLPLFYLVVKFTNFGLIGVISVEAIGYFANFLAYSYLIRRFFINEKVNL